MEGRDPAEILPATLPQPIAYTSQREFVRNVPKNEVNLRAAGTQFVEKVQEPERSLRYRQHLNSEGSPTQTVAGGYQRAPRTELSQKVPGQAVKEAV